MTPKTDNNTAAVLAALQAVKDAGLSGVTRTSLVKLVYLLDCLYAEGHQGATLTGGEWKFLHYGPFSGGLAGAIDQGDQRGLLQSRGGEKGDRDFTLYWLGEYPLGPSLESLGFASDLAMQFARWVRLYSQDLARLLDFVYYRTAPMIGAEPGQALSFDDIGKESRSAPVAEVKITNPADLIAIRRLVSNMSTRRQSRRAAVVALESPRPIYDRLFFDSMGALEADDEEFTPVPFRAVLA